MFSKPQQYSQGDLNADYAVRVNKFFTTYETRTAPEVPGPDPAKPLFKGYQVSSFGSTKKWVIRSVSIWHSSIFSLSDIRSKARSWRMWSLSFWICWGPGEKGFICFPIFNWTIKDTWRAQVFFLGLFSKHQWCRWNLAFSSRWTTSWNGSRSQSSAAIQMQSPGTVSLMTTARTPWSGTWNHLMPRRQEIRTFGSIATAGHKPLPLTCHKL